MKRVISVLTILACTAVLCGCGAKEIVVTPEFDVTLYSGASLDDAIAFTETPVEKKELVRGAPADAAHLAIAQGLLQARDEKSVEVFRRLLHPESLGLLDKPGEEQTVHAMAQQVLSGEFLHAKENPKFFVTQEPPHKRDLERLFPESKAKPSTSVTFYQYHRPKDMLIGDKFFLVEEDSSLKVIFPVRTKHAQQDAGGKRDVAPPDSLRSGNVDPALPQL